MMKRREEHKIKGGKDCDRKEAEHKAGKEGRKV